MSRVSFFRLAKFEGDYHGILRTEMVLRVANCLLLLAVMAAAQSSKAPPDIEEPNPAAAMPDAPGIASCPAGGPLGAVDMEVRSPRNGDQPLPFRMINHLSEGDVLSYSPVKRGKEKRPGEVALVMVPAKREKGAPLLIVTDPKPAEKAQEWKIPETVSLVALTYGPQGLSKRKVRNFLSQDDLLVAQLADYADKTAQTEALIAALSNGESSSASVNSALNGFASQYGFAVQIDKNAPVTAQAQTLFATMNPQLATYNPLGSSTGQRAGQTASLATAAATLFFGSPVGLAAGGTAMLLDLRSIAFPDTQFRSSFAQPLPNKVAGVNLCGERTAIPAHTRVAYIWASRIPNAPTPTIKIGDAPYIPLMQKSPMPVDVPEAQWKYLQRARAWSLEDDAHRKTPIPVLKLGNQNALELDLTKANLAPGDYRLTGFWDWVGFEAVGDIHVRPLSNFEKAKLEPRSQDNLLSKAGKIPVTLEGGDFEFTTKTEIKKLGDEFATPEPVRFILPEGLRKGPQEHMDVQLDTHNLDAGNYQLLIAQQDGSTHPVPFKILPNPPRIVNFPIVANQGVAVQHYVLKGERLNGLAKMAAPGAAIELEPAANGNEERSITVQLKAGSPVGTKLPIEAYLQDRSEPVTFADALEVTGPLPAIASSKLSLPSNMAIAIQQSEFPAGLTLAGVLDVKNIENQSILRLACADDSSSAMALHVGEQTGTFTLQQLSQDQVFLSLDTSSLRAGCNLQATLDNGRGGSSQPVTLARIIRVPQIDSFTYSTDLGPNGAHTFVLNGANLEMIEKVGWDQSAGVAVPGLPTPVPGRSQKQTLEVNLPDPPVPQAPLEIWLRGDTQARSTTIKCPAIPAVTVTAPNAKAQPLSSGVPDPSGTPH